MVEVRARHALVAVLGASLWLLGGCASQKTEVKDSWLARVPEAQLASVRQAQANRNRASDAVTRADVAVGDADRALDVARRNVDASKNRKKAEEATLKAAEVTGQSSSIAQAQAQLRGADAELAAAQAQVGWRAENVDAWKSQKQLRERELELADAQLAYSRFLALKQHGDVRVKDISEGELKHSISKAQDKVAEARQDADSKAQRAQKARVAWEQLRMQAQGYGGSGGWNRE
jgi:hypothetical protein